MWTTERAHGEKPNGRIHFGELSADSLNNFIKFPSGFVGILLQAFSNH